MGSITIYFGEDVKESDAQAVAEKIQNKFVYYLIKIPYWIIFPITFLWTLLTFQYFNNQEKLKRYKN